jgi:hypothetical protein
MEPGLSFWGLRDMRTMGGSGKHQLADGSWMQPNAIGKLRTLRLPLPPVPFQLERAENTN